ncbi:spore coat protein [Caldalkalibacillus salinus]|uniref:spore coat protein n=1 Tax=Caldalkalibacillus salinus TaxID=2803787 RepID=UPI001923B23F|nr:spore coat protein [Caldalkalibacillus salinus]
MHHHHHQPQHHLAWHETLELHELLAFQSVGVFKLKNSIAQVRDPQLRQLYQAAIQAMSQNLQELLPFVSLAPRQDERHKFDDTGFFAGDLLALAKTLVRNYAIAITETATPQLREVLTKQLLGAIQLHEQAFLYMCERSYYPAYDLEALLANDVKNATMALELPY